MIEIFQYWPRHEPVPEGWGIVDDMKSCHHGVYAVLIRKFAGEAV